MASRRSRSDSSGLFNPASGGVVVLCGLAAWASLAVAGPARAPWVAVPWALIAIAAVLGIRMCRTWERAVVLRLGRIRGVYGPGLFLIVPFVDQIASIVDGRIRTIPVHTERTLTRDTTPIDVDAVVFWIVHDPMHAVTQLDDYADAVELVALTTLREVVGSMNLASLLEDRRRIDDELRALIAEKIAAWGITVQSVEIRDVTLPANLQDAMSRQAQAERERAARVTLAAAERAVALELAEAAKTYDASPTALQLLQINRIYEMNKDRGTTILLPTSMADSMANLAATSVAMQAAADKSGT